jgi:thiamine pyrophosphate-dependent acetolactate synthase large subunit-like protein
MIRYDCFEWLAPQMTDQLVVTSLSGQRVEWGHLSKRDADLNLGSMGNALAVGIGLALALPRRKVFVFESDGIARSPAAMWTCWKPNTALCVISSAPRASRSYKGVDNDSHERRSREPSPV